MPTTPPLRIGHIPYLNCEPFFHFLSDCGCRGEQVSGVPSALNRLLQQGEIDVSPSSSFEYARNWRNYLLLPGHAIASAGPVESVLLFSPIGLEGLGDVPIAVTGDSATSINLLRILLREFIGLDRVQDEVPAEPVEQLIASGRPALLIGDRALQTACKRPHGMRRYDLGQLWQEYTGLPFVFALWIVRRAALQQHGAALRALGGQLHQARRRFFSEVETLAETLGPGSCLTTRGKVDYWRNIDYALTDKHLEGLRLFFELCCKYQFLDEMPEIAFLEE